MISQWRVRSTNSNRHWARWRNHIELAQWRVKSTNPTRHWASWTHHIQLSQWRVGSSNPTCHWTSWTHNIQLAQWRVGSISSNFPSGNLDHSHTMHSRLWNSLFRVSIKLSLVSSRSKLPLKFYVKNDKDLFSRMNLNQLNKTIPVTLTP